MLGGQGASGSTTGSSRWTRRPSTIPGSPRPAPPEPSRPGKWTRACCAADCRRRRSALPFLPIRAGLGSSVPDFWEGELQTVTSPYPAPERRTRKADRDARAAPGCRVSLHLNLGDSQGNAAYTGIDPYFDDLFLMAAEKRFLSVERVVSTEELVKAVPPQALLINRMMVDAVVETPGGAHFTTAAPDYGRDETFQRHYAEAASTEEGWQQFVQTYLSGSEDDYQAAVAAFAAEASK